MSFFKWVGMLSLVFFVSCGGGKKTDQRREKRNEAPKQGEESVMLENYIRNVEPVKPQDLEGQSNTEGITDKTQNVPIQNLKCNISNYREYIYDFQKMNQLIAETGSGCYLPGVDFTGQDLTNAVFTKSDLRRAIFKTANLDGAKFIDADLTGAILEDTNYMEAYFRGATLTEATYNYYDGVVAWLRGVNGQGIQDPEGKGMILYEGG